METLLISLGVVFAIIFLLVAAFCCSAVKACRKRRKTGNALIWQTKAGITISISPAKELPGNHEIPQTPDPGTKVNHALLSPRSPPIPDAHDFRFKGRLTRVRSYSM